MIVSPPMYALPARSVNEAGDHESAARRVNGQDARCFRVGCGGRPIRVLEETVECPRFRLLALLEGGSRSLEGVPDIFDVHL